MTVYVGLGIADKPRVQHLAKPVPDDWEPRPVSLSLCRQSFVTSAEDHDRARRQYGFRKPLTPIDYDHLPMCKRCEKARRQ